jgi:predicted N-formylglutamate amidohydrolase
LDELASLSATKLIISLHSFTPLYNGQKRDVEIGILYNLEEKLATQIADRYSELGYDCRLNEPWSGQAGYMFASDHAGRNNDCQVIMIEYRNDLLTSAQWRGKAATELLDILTSLKRLPKKCVVGQE